MNNEYKFMWDELEQMLLQLLINVEEGLNIDPSIVNTVLQKCYSDTITAILNAMNDLKNKYN